MVKVWVLVFFIRSYSFKKIFDNKQISGLSSTHSSNPIACAAGIATIEIISSKKLTINSKRQGVILHKNLKKITTKFNKIVFLSLGKGLIGSLIFKNFKNYSGKEIADLVTLKCLNKKLLVCNTGRNQLNLAHL